MSKLAALSRMSALLRLRKPAGCAFGIAVAADVRADVVGFGIEGFFVQLLGAVG